MRPVILLCSLIKNGWTKRSGTPDLFDDGTCPRECTKVPPVASEPSVKLVLLRQWQRPGIYAHGPCRRRLVNRLTGFAPLHSGQASFSILE